MSDPNSGNGPGQGGYGQNQPGQGGDFGQGNQGYGAGGGFGPPPGQSGQGQYGPPPGQYGPPPGQYGQGQYGPPPGQYGPPPGQYGQGQYGPPPGQYGQGQYGGAGGYGSMPAAQLPPPVSAADAPQPVRQAVMLMFAQAALGVLGIIITLVTLSSVKDTIRKANPDYDTTKIDSLVNAIVIASIVFGVIFLVLYVLLALQVRKGKNWARIVTWVLAGLSLVIGLVSLGGNAAGISKGLEGVQLVIDVAIIVLLVRGGSFFAKRRLQ